MADKREPVATTIGGIPVDIAIRLKCVDLVRTLAPSVPTAKELRAMAAEIEDYALHGGSQAAAGGPRD